MFEVLANSIEKLKQEDDGYVIQFQPYNHNEGDPFILVIISPLMRRVHEMVRNFPIYFCK